MEVPQSLNVLDRPSQFAFIGYVYFGEVHLGRTAPYVLLSSVSSIALTIATCVGASIVALTANLREPFRSPSKALSQSFENRSIVSAIAMAIASKARFTATNSFGGSIVHRLRSNATNDPDASKRASTARRAQTKEVIGQHGTEVFITECAVGAWRMRNSRPPCAARGNLIGYRLNQLGWCFGKHRRTSADMEWHRCTSRSLRVEIPSNYCIAE
jgi:hypothetical protein